MLQTKKQQSEDTRPNADSETGSVVGRKTAAKRKATASAHSKDRKEVITQEKKPRRKNENMRPPKAIDCRLPMPRKPTWLANRQIGLSGSHNSLFDID